MDGQGVNRLKERGAHTYGFLHFEKKRGSCEKRCSVYVHCSNIVQYFRILQQSPTNCNRQGKKTNPRSHIRCNV